MSSGKLAIVCAAAVAALGLIVTAFNSAARAGNTGGFVGVVAFVMVGVVLVTFIRYFAGRHQSKHQLTSGEQYRALAEEYRRLSDLAITAQEHTDLKMGEISVQLDYLRTQNESLQRILKEVE